MLDRRRRRTLQQSRGAHKARPPLFDRMSNQYPWRMSRVTFRNARGLRLVGDLTAAGDALTATSRRPLATAGR